MLPTQQQSTCIVLDHCLSYLMISIVFLFHQDDPNLQVAIKSCKNAESREKFLEEACGYKKGLC